MELPIVVFACTALFIVLIHVRSQLEFYRSINNLQRALKQQGIEWNYWRDWRLRLKFQSDPGAILSDADSSDVRVLKQQVIEQRQKLLGLFPRLMKIALLGLAATVFSAFLQMLLQKH